MLSDKKNENQFFETIEVIKAILWIMILAMAWIVLEEIFD